ncbi:MAG: class I SAM-dependent methyltransferase [Candidatus Hadarchaeales archaeon]
MTAGFFYGGMWFRLNHEVYEPADDSFMIAENMEISPGEEVLEIGTGCGFLAIIAAKRGARVVATDINQAAIQCSRENAAMHGVEKNVDLRLGDLFDPVLEERFDLIIFNPPYLPSTLEERRGGRLELSWDGGDDGRRVVDRFIEGLPAHLKKRGRSLFVQSSLTGNEKTLELIEKNGLRGEIVARRKFFFEEIVLIRCETPDTRKL